VRRVDLMDITTMTTNAVSCVLSVRLRPVGQILMADNRAQGEGTTVSFAARQGRGVAGAGSLVEGLVPAAARTFDPDYKTIDVARSRSGRPPV
jgi:hypothetical protein